MWSNEEGQSIVHTPASVSLHLVWSAVENVMVPQLTKLEELLSGFVLSASKTKN